MHRRPLLAVAFAMALVAPLVVACGGSSATLLTDPKEILAKSVDALGTVKTVHVKADLSGTLSLDLTGQGASAPFDLSGITAEGDVDVTNNSAQLTFAAPSLLESASTRW